MPPLRWRHVIINTKSTWLHGDPRGFRDRKHRIHSNGDYRNPPPMGEHEGLHEYMKSRASAEVRIDKDLRAGVGRAIVEYYRDQGIRLVALSIGKVHSHQLVELVDDVPKIRESWDTRNGSRRARPRMSIRGSTTTV